MRGPNWTFYGPFEVWDAHKLVAQNNINISEIFWIKMLNMGLPSSILLREMPGLLSTLVYFIGGSWAVTKYWGQKYIKSLGRARYSILVFLILVMMSLPIKMYLRFLINLKYIVAMPEFEFNI